MALEVATLPSQLVTTNPPSGDNMSEGDDHIRLLKVCVKNAAAAPAFSATQSVAQSVPNNTFTKVSLTNEEFDTAACYDNAVNYRFTPNVAGYYQVNWTVTLASTATVLTAVLYKNGAQFKHADFGTTITSGSALVSMNGSTDYLEVFVFQTSAGAINTSADPTLTYFQAFCARLA